ncbi:MAG TPA: hypothetical protein VKE94_10225 [Gemmataceae bacterium]|nr:hypothetical protein [Gemmataceae bacterium]
MTSKGESILKKMQQEYGAEKGKSVFYASKNAGKITGVEQRRRLALEAARLRQQLFPHLRQPRR